jgi:GTP-binding protein HflX
VRERIAYLESQIERVRASRQQRRAARVRREMPVVSIVGYTNAGKSTLLNALTSSRVTAEQRMFATLDPTSRRLRLPHDQEVIINDTVGFIRDLPKDLLAAFRSTLEEIADSDLLVHLVDMSHPRHEAQIKAVEAILQELGDADIPRLLVFNKADLVDHERREEILEAHEGAMSIAAAKREGLTALLRAMDDRLARRKAVGAG